MFDIYNFVITNLFPTLPMELYFLIPITCIIILGVILLLVVSPFIMIFMLLRKW